MTRAWIATAVCLLVWTGSAEAADLSFSWDGTVVFVDENLPGAIHGDVVVGVTGFDGFFVYPDTCNADCLVEPFGSEETNYVFANGLAGLSGGGGYSRGVESSVNIIDDQIVDEESVAFGALLGLSLTVGQTLDVWSVASETAGEFTTDFVDWNVEYIYSTSDPWSTTDYVATPPPNPDVILFAINQDDGDVFFAFGGVNSVPEPTLGLSLAVGALGLLGPSRGRRRDVSRFAAGRRG